MRISQDQYYMNIAAVVAMRSTCLRRRVGAVIVVDNHIVSTGYNGAASGIEHCLDVGCMREMLGIPSGTDLMNCKAVHAEANAIIQCAVHGVSPRGGVLYCTHAPCMMCAKMIINAKISRVIFDQEYPNMQETITLFEQAGVWFCHMAI